MIDFPQLKDPEWIAKRAKQWEIAGEYMSDTLRKKELKKLQHYYMTGELWTATS